MDYPEISPATSHSLAAKFFAALPWQVPNVLRQYRNKHYETHKETFVSLYSSTYIYFVLPFYSPHFIIFFSRRYFIFEIKLEQICTDNNEDNFRISLRYFVFPTCTR